MSIKKTQVGRLATACVVLSVFVCTWCSVEAGESPFNVPVGQRQLFLDDHGIAKLDNLKRTMHQPAKRGAVVEPDQFGETCLQTRCTPVWDPEAEVYKLWMITSADPTSGTTYAESRDGLYWTKPILRQREINGSLENNHINVGPGQLEWPANAIENVVFDPDDPDPSRRYKGLAHCFVREPIVSPDGKRWKRLKVPPLPSQDESNMGYDRETRTFIATLKCGGPYGRSHAIWTSKDFEKWTNTNVVFHADAEDQRLAKANIQARLADPKLYQPGISGQAWATNDPARYNADIYNMGIFRYEGLYVGLPAVYHAASKRDGFHLIQLATSRDLKKWKRLGDRKPFIGPSPVGSGAYDLAQLLPPSAPLVRGDALWFYYTGIKYRAKPKNADPDPDPAVGAVCLAVLRRDGFISLDAGETPGTLLTEPFVVRGTELSVNVDAAEGALEVAVLDGQGESLVVSKPVVGDQPRGVVEWQSGDLANLKARTVQLRFTLKNSSLYSYWLK